MYTCTHVRTCMYVCIHVCCCVWSFRDCGFLELCVCGCSLGLVGLGYQSTAAVS